jgi:hypothetical protein
MMNLHAPSLRGLILSGLFSVLAASGCAGQAETESTSASVPAALSGNYVGCYTDEKTRDLTDEAVSAGSMSVETCVADCGKAGYAYAGVQYGKQCFCGNTYGKYGTSTSCNMTCSGDSAETCGGSYANSIYKVAAATTPPPPSSSASLGCYKDESTRDLTDQTSLSPVSVETCTSTCKSAGYAYAGVQYGSQCFCGNAYGKYGTATDCNMACNGKSSETCGGTWANNIYATGASSTTPTPPPPPPPAPSGSGTCSPSLSGPGGAGSANISGSQIPAYPKFTDAYTVTGLGSGDAGPIIQAALNAGHTQIIIPGSGSFGSPTQYKIATQVNVPAGVIIECEEGAQFLDPTACTDSMPGLFVWTNETASVTGAGMYGCMFKGTAVGSGYATSYNHVFVRIQESHNFTIEGNITTNSCGDADFRLDGSETSASDHGSTGNLIAFNSTNFAENGLAVINAWNNTVKCNYFNGGGVDEEPNHSFAQVGENTYTLNYTTGGGVSIGGNSTSCPPGSGVCAKDFVTKNVFIGPGPIYCECASDGSACDNKSFGGTWTGNLISGESCKCGGESGSTCGQ